MRRIRFDFDSGRNRPMVIKTTDRGRYRVDPQTSLIKGDDRPEFWLGRITRNQFTRKLLFIEQYALVFAEREWQVRARGRSFRQNRSERFRHHADVIIGARVSGV